MKHFILNLIIMPFIGFSQIGIGTLTPESTLDVFSNTYGLVLPRVELISPTDITTITQPNGGTPLAGTFVYNIGTSGLTPAGYYVWNDTKWVSLKKIPIGDIKQGFQTIDHNGWYLLDGRLLTSLSASAQVVANQLGMVGNLPDMENAYLRGSNSSISEPLGNISGSLDHTITLAGNNLPSYNLPNGSTEIAGNHNHASVSTSTAPNHRHNWTETGTRTVRASNTTASPRVNLVRPNFFSNSSTTIDSHAHAGNSNYGGVHGHTEFSGSTTGGSNTSFNVMPRSIVINTFIYLGL